jgi:Putative zinc-finger
VQGNGRGASGTRAACIDAETLAAWADGGLSKSDAAAVETHLADCERCTAMLATFVRSTPETPAVESLWKRWHLRWLVPVATAATVAALWVLVPRPGSQVTTLGPAPSTESQALSSADRSANAMEPAAPADAKEQEAPAAATQSKPADAFAKREEVQQAPQQLADARRDTDEKVQQPQSLNETVAVAPPVPREADRTESRIIDRQTTREAPAAPAASPAPAAAAPPAGFSVSAESSARRAVTAPGRGQTSIFEVASPDPMTRWRVVGAGQVERSTNGGARWEAATLPESATLTAGSSPSPSICWLVGRTGSIYVTTDGLRFVRVPFTDPSDFVSIQATDGRRATIVTIDGRTMRTEDQGATWIRVSP